MDEDHTRKRKLPPGLAPPSRGVEDVLASSGSGKPPPLFSIGVAKKSRFDREKELREQRQREADEETKKAYASFVASFDQDDSAPAFVPSEGHHAASSKPRPFSATPPPLARPHQGPPRQSFPPPLVSRPPPKTQPTASRDAPAKAPAPFAFSLDDDDVPEVAPKRKVREMDRFLEEIKDSGFEPVASSPYDTGGDEDSTNLYVNNLAPSVTEAQLRALFGAHGPIYSIKVMWPRSDEERARGRNCGFVCFCKRLHADSARIHLNETKLEGFEISVGWGKGVKMDPTAVAALLGPTLSVPPRAHGAPPGPPPAFLRPPPSGPPPVFMRPPPPGQLPPPRPFPPGLGAPPRPTLGPPRPLLTPPRPILSSPPPTVIVEPPADKEQMALINYVARCVSKDGPQFEDLMRRSQLDPKYDFLRAPPTSSLNIYYKWKVYSLQMGDTDTTWRTMGFQMVPNGPMWIPPPNPDGDPSTLTDASASMSQTTPSHQHPRSPKKNPVIMTGQQLAAFKDKEKGQRAKFELSRREYDTLCSYLEEVTIDRQSVCDVMAFALDHSECAVDIATSILKYFRVDVPGGPNGVQPYLAYVARLFVVSDILHNSSAPLKNASLYRTQFEEFLPEIMDSLNVVSHAIVGRMSFNAMRDKVLAVLHAWSQWSLFPPAYLIGLNATFLQKARPARATSQDQDTPDDVPMATVRAAIDADTLNLNDERLKRKCRHAGLVSSGTRDDMFRRLYMLKKFTSVGEGTPDGVKETPAVDEDVDGEPMEGADDDDDIDGVPLDDDFDIDGVPLDDDDDVVGDEDVDGEPMEVET
ncbi:hypothetical protein H310_12027 [Aphanomyces invadans]|uniref:Uncharacterized protein n=1 Tax=Aphanomyces invadans TaxID=157072 RepID=A0A024TM69_9STRA|nr:hypothetical protein H310_12027 [Aphanomyces invadans]ETV94392.1 hypothetical protein H310_12027 [Aphanomyces invadans]|eukprot:XP_008877154.1 hypothetical protein H310_12027 [Aphanomyces invadans]